MLFPFKKLKRNKIPCIYYQWYQISTPSLLSGTDSLWVTPSTPQPYYYLCTPCMFLHLVCKRIHLQDNSLQLRIHLEQSQFQLRSLFQRNTAVHVLVSIMKIPTIYCQENYNIFCVHFVRNHFNLMSQLQLNGHIKIAVTTANQVIQVVWSMWKGCGYHIFTSSQLLSSWLWLFWLSAQTFTTL